MTRATPSRLVTLAASLALLGAGLSGCTATASQAPATRSTHPAGSWLAASGAAQSAAAVSLVPGNSVSLPVPADLPASAAAKASRPTCGVTISFEVDPDASPAPTLPSNLTGSAANDAALGCLLSAWRAHAAAALWTVETTDEQDEVFTIYRLSGDGTLDVIVRLASHTEKTVTWTETACRDLTLQDGRVTPMDCASEVVIH